LNNLQGWPTLKKARPLGQCPFFLKVDQKLYKAVNHQTELILKIHDYEARIMELEHMIESLIQDAQSIKR